MQEILIRLRDMKADIDELNAKIQELYDTRPAARFDFAGGSPGGVYSDPAGDAAVKIARLEEKRDRILSDRIDLYTSSFRNN